jgi:TatD DNase family protein
MAVQPQILVDSHCHLPLILEQGAELDQILINARDAGVGHILCVSVDLETYPEIKQIAADNEHIYSSIGVHPNTEVETEPTVDDLVQLVAEDPKAIAIGETGLDYFRSTGDLSWQHERFITHINSAIAVNKPLIIHTRDSGEDTIRILKENNADKVQGIMHCFVEDYEIAKKALDLGFYISFSGIVTFKNAQQVQDVAKRIPLDRLLVETDSPYLAPVPHRGKQNQPAYVRHVAEFVAELRQIDVDELISITTDNFFKLFRLQ